MDYKVVESEFLRPLTHAWINKIEAASRSTARTEWRETADECMMFYSRSAAAMWNPNYSKKFWKGVKLPRFRVTINKAFEMVAVFGPNLFWEMPHREIDAKRPTNIPMDMFGPEDQQLAQQIAAIQQQENVRDRAISYLMGQWLNYTPREQPGGGLSGHSWKATIDGLIKGRGVLAPRPYKMPASSRNLTGAFREKPEDIYLDPDFDDVADGKWMAIRHIDTHTAVEKRFKLPEGSLKQKASLESAWQHSELNTDSLSPAHRKEGMTNDLVVWYEIYSKSGIGSDKTNMDPKIRRHLDETVGQYAYIAVAADCPWPLNMHSDRMRRGATDDDVRDAFSWPTPLWADDRWPVEFLDFYTNPDSAYPVPPLGPGLGELKLLNFLVSWFANRTWSSSRDFWAVAMPHLEHYKEYINNSDDQAIIPTPVGVKSPKEAIEILTQPEGRHDMTQLITFVSDMFDRRVGLTPTAYGQNEGGTQSRTAEETMAKQRAVMARPEFMQKQVVDWQSRVASSEAFLTRWFVKGNDIEQFMGPAGRMMWERYVESTDIELVTRQFSYTVAAASIRRPNRDRDIGNFQQVMNMFAPVLAEYGRSTGNFDPWNGMVQEWGELHDAELDAIYLPNNTPSEEEQAQQAAMQQEAAQLEMQELAAKVQKTNAEAQKIGQDIQIAPIQLQMGQQAEQLKMQSEQLKAQLEMQKGQQQLMIKQQEAQLGMQLKMADQQMKMQGTQQKIESDATSARQKMQVDAISAQSNMQMDQQKHEQELAQDQEKHDQELDQQEEQNDLDMAVSIEQARLELDIQEEKADAQVEAIEKQAAAKPEEPKKESNNDSEE